MAVLQLQWSFVICVQYQRLMALFSSGSDKVSELALSCVVIYS
jgi:hypothetical protein